MGSDPTVSAPLQLLHTSAGRLHSNARHFPTHFFMHTNGILWLAGNRQITLFDTHTHKFKETPQALRSHPLLLHANVNYIHPYGSNSLLLNTDQQGMFLYNYVEGYVIHQSENGFPFEVPHFKISTMFTDSQKTCG